MLLSARSARGGVPSGRSAGNAPLPTTQARKARKKDHWRQTLVAMIRKPAARISQRRVLKDPRMAMKQVYGVMYPELDP